MQRRLMNAAIAMALLAACGKEGAAPAANIEDERPETKAAPLFGAGWDEALASKRGETISMSGTFRGGDEPSCAFASTTRPIRAKRAWDWLIEKDGRCMWVANQNRMFGDPEAVLDRASIGRRVEITAVVREDDAGLLYLDAVEATALE